MQGTTKYSGVSCVDLSVKMIFPVLNNIGLDNYQTPYILGLSIFLSHSNSGKPKFNHIDV